MNLKLCDSEVEMSTETSSVNVFDINNPEGPYALKMDKVYDQIVLQSLLNLSAELAEASEYHPSGAFEQKACFAGVKYNNKGNWNPPTERLQSGLWDFSAFETGNLTFNFALDPHAYKLEMKKINKMIAEAESAGKPIADPKALKPAPKEFVSVKTMSRGQA